MVIINNKKSEDKSLNMIFGLFVLLIVSVVAITLFLHTTSQATGGMKNAAGQYFKQQTLDKAISECNQECETAQTGTPGQKLDFCKKGFSIDWNGNGDISDKILGGYWEFCEQKIPCFIISNIEDKKCHITPDECHKILTSPGSATTNDVTNIVYPEIMNNSPEGACNLDVPDDPSSWSEYSPNWRLRFLKQDIDSLETGEYKIEHFDNGSAKRVKCYNSELLKAVQTYTDYQYPNTDQMHKINLLPPCNTIH